MNIQMTLRLIQNVFILILISSCSLQQSTTSVSCGRILKFSNPDEIIYAYCPTLPDLSPRQARSAVLAVFERMAGLDGEYLIYFFNDESLLAHTNWMIGDETDLRAQWGDTFIGSYYTHNNKLTIWPNSPERTRVIELPYL